MGVPGPLAVLGTSGLGKQVCGMMTIIRTSNSTSNHHHDNHYPLPQRRLVDRPALVLPCIPLVSLALYFLKLLLVYFGGIRLLVSEFLSHVL